MHLLFSVSTFISRGTGGSNTYTIPRETGPLQKTFKKTLQWYNERKKTLFQYHVKYKEYFLVQKQGNLSI